LLNLIYGKGEKTQNQKAYWMPMLKGMGLRRPSKSTLGSQRLRSCWRALYKSAVRQRSGLYFSIRPMSGAAWKKKTAC
jgi:hypothetical protein